MKAASCKKVEKIGSRVENDWEVKEGIKGREKRVEIGEVEAGRGGDRMWGQELPNDKNRRRKLR